MFLNIFVIMEKNEYSYIGNCNPPISGGYQNASVYTKIGTKGFVSQQPPVNNDDDAFTYQPSPEAIKQQKLEELYEDLNHQTKRDIEWNAAKTEMEKINLLYQEMQSINKNLFNISKMLIEKM